MPDSPPAEDPLFGNPASDLLRGALEEAKSTTPGGPWEPPAPEELETLLPQYEIECMLGRGGMGAVYKGRQLSLDRPVAIKILSNHLASADASFASRFKNEARAMAKLSHPGIVAVYDFGEAINGLLYIVMEFVEGTDVARMIVSQGRLHSEHAMAITAHVCDALAYAHERGIIHRDIKPANIMLRNDGVVKVADFGLAKFSTSSGETLGLTQSGMAMGTPHFVAPEALILGVTLDQRADIYAVGVMLYQMLTGKLPQGLFELPSLQIPGLDPRYDGIIGKALREDREVRYPSVLDMRRDLDAILTQPVAKVEASAEKAPAALTTHALPQHAAARPYRPPSGPPRPAPPPQSSSSGLVAAVVLVVAGAAAFFFLVMDRPAPTDSSAQPQSEAENGMSTLAQSPEATPSSTDPVQATKDKPFVNTLGMKFVPVPGSDILMCIHETRKGDYRTYAGENSSIDGGWEKPHRDGIPMSFADDHPVCNVSWNDATAFCDWLSKKEQRRYRLPTDREWSMAVGIGGREDASLTPESLTDKIPGEYIWGTQWPPPKGAGNFADTATKEVFPERKTIEGYTDGFATSAPVMSFLPNPLGIYDLGGNLWEFCGDFFDKAKTVRVVRGGNWDDGGYSSRPFLAATRGGAKPELRHNTSGFRCVLEMTDAAYSPPPRPDASTPSKSSNPTKDQPFVNTLGMKFVPVPGTDILMCIHETRKADYAAFFAATPGVPAFWQNPSYEGAPVSFADDHPVCNIRWQDCRDFCQWLSRKEGRTYRLPTDREWSFAVGIGDREDAGTSPHLLSDKLTGEFPWGRQWPPPARAGNLGDTTMVAKFPKRRVIPGYTDGFATTAPVMSFTPNPFGLYDLSGNVWEFCEDWYDETRTTHVIRGLNFDDGGDSSVRFLSSHRGWCPAPNRHANHGFRVVLKLEAKPASASPAVPVIPSSTSAVPRNDPEMTALLEFERELRSHTWVIPDRNWELRFENNHRAPIDERVYSTRWHWWIIGPRSLHVQFAAAPAAYDPNSGAEYIFDKNMKGFTNGTGKPTGVRGSALAAPAESDLGRSFAPDYAPKLGGGLPSQFPSL